MFKEVDSKVNLVEMEEEVLRFWQENQIYQKSLENRKDDPRYVFYEGPPTANGLPHVGHVLTRIYKDIIPRYQTMKGKYVLRKGGWDCHGLPVEIEVEKELGFSGKQAIEEYGVAEFNQKCQESVFRYVKEWRRLSDRIGFWIDMDDPYVTLTNEYIESVWWILRQLWDRNLLYQGYKVVPYCPRCGTPLSDHEVSMGYAQADDPSVYVKFPVRDEPGTYFLSWTTTPWTLPGNAALAVHPQVEYAVAEVEGTNGEKENLILAADLLPQVLSGEYRVVKKMKAKDLVGKHYQPLFTFLPVPEDYCYVVAADFVTTEEGTGIVHIAPAFGAEDLEMGKEHDLPILRTVDLAGRFIDAVTSWRGLFVKEADPLITQDLEERGLLYRAGRYKHTYPFCWRCHTPLLYYAKTTWFIETTRLKEELLANNQKIEWYPEYIRDGRFGNWLENNVDWTLGRERYWGTPLPVWECDDCGRKECVGSIGQLQERAGRSLPDLDLHRPYVDGITFRCEECEAEMHRVPEVIDAWFDSGAMFVAQWHYPFENQALFQEQYPADFICEAVDQTRGWFYSLHAISTLLFNEPCFLHVISLGLVLDGEGRKMSKSLGNVVDPWDVLRLHGADALRWYLYTASPPWHERRFSVELVGEVVRKLLLTLWNTYSFFVTYANLDFEDWKKEGGDSSASQLLKESQDREGRGRLAEFQLLDRWVLAELHSLVKRVDDRLAAYDPTSAARAIQEFVDKLSNWYVRRSRRRFWKAEEDADKLAAYLTLYECLVTLAKLLAPFTPFVAEEIYRNLVLSVDGDVPQSVHLADFPLADESLIDEKLMADTKLMMRLVSLGHAARNRAGLKVRQPLAQALIKTRDPEERRSLETLGDQVTEELNVKELAFVEDELDLVDYTLNPVSSLLGPKYGELFPKVREALAGMEANEVGRHLRAGQPVELTVEGQVISLTPEEVEVGLVAKEGYAVAEEGGYLVAITTTLTPTLRSEGLARELVRRIQTLRKEADFRVEDTIVTYYEGDPALGQVMVEHSDYIKQETLSRSLVEGSPPEGCFTRTMDIEDHRVTLGVVRS
ncbi:MAG: isoleucine--tRNA ligase [Anaerolineae bacterium]